MVYRCKTWGSSVVEHKSHKLEVEGSNPSLMTNIRECDIHGKVKFYRKVRNYWVCSKCDIQRHSLMRKQLKARLVEYKGGCCERCGYSKSIKALEFHHRNPSRKDFSIAGAGSTKNFDKAKLEVDKCILVCANCHREIHEEIECGVGTTALS